MAERDLDRLRERGFTDEQIVIATQVIGYFAYINRMADALGVDPEENMRRPTREEWLAGKGQNYGAEME